MNKVYSFALFVDLPNFYSHLLQSGIKEPRFLRDYFLYWLDFDILSEALAGVVSPTWIFYSGRRFGPSNNRIEGRYLNDYVKRINSLRGVTAKDVNIPGEQREPASYQCDSCGHQGIAEWESEKGIDSSLTVHLFDTMETWDIAFLLSGDADFVPAVSSLRRRGKIIVGAGFAQVSSALVRECYDYKNLSDEFLVMDVLAYSLFGENGIIHQWLFPHKDRKGRFSVAWKNDLEKKKLTIVLEANIQIARTRYADLLKQLNTEFPDVIKEININGILPSCTIVLNSSIWNSIRKRLDVITSIEGLEGPLDYPNNHQGYRMLFKQDSS